MSSLFGVSPVNSLGSFSSFGLPSLQNASLVSSQTHISGYGQLLSALSTFQKSIKNLEQPGSLSNPTATSSSTNVAIVSATSAAAAGTYSLNVTTLAQAQTATSAGIASSDTIVGSGTLTVQIGSVDTGTQSFTATRSAVSISINNGSLSTIAKSINDADAGVTASVTQDAGGYHLQIQSSQTGAANGFKLTTSDYDGTSTNTSGLSQFAFDPLAAIGSGKNLVQSQAGTDAAYTVNGTKHASATNTAVQLAGGVSADFLQTGASSIAVVQDFNGLQASATKLIDAFNILQAAVSKQLGSGGSLHGDMLGAVLSAQLNGQAQDSVDNTGSALNSLSDIGINFRASSLSATGGALTLDSKTLQSAFTADPKGTTNVLAQAAQAFDTLADKYDGTNGKIQAASQSLQLFQSLSPFAQSSSSGSFSALSDLLGGQSAFDSATNTRLGILAIQAYAQDQLLSGASSGNALVSSGLFGAPSTTGGSLLSIFA